MGVCKDIEKDIHSLAATAGGATLGAAIGIIGGPLGVAVGGLAGAATGASLSGHLARTTTAANNDQYRTSAFGSIHQLIVGTTDSYKRYMKKRGN